MLYDLLGICYGDLARAKKLYSEQIPACVKIPNFEALPYGFDLCAHLLQCVADEFYRQRGLRVTVHKNFLCSSFEYCSDEEEEIQKLADNGDEIAAFILFH